MTRYCPPCGQEQNVRTEVRPHDLVVCGDSIHISAETLIREVCGQRISDAERDDRILKQAYDSTGNVTDS